MRLNKKDLSYEFTRGKGPGGQHRNKTENACRIYHLPTGLSAYADERSRRHSIKSAESDLRRKLHSLRASKKAEAKKARRDEAIRDSRVIRTYDFKKNVVKDHTTKKTASLKDVLIKGMLHLLRR